jgi:hypothetical protein
MLLVLGYHFKPMSYAMLFFGIVLFASGRKAILRLASAEGSGQYLACLLVPFYDTWFTYTRLTRTWAPCMICWAGRAFSLAAGILLLLHFLRTDVSEAQGPTRAENPKAHVAEVDMECEKLLAAPNKAEAKSWLEEPNKRRGFFKWGKKAPLEFVKKLYDRGAKEVIVADIESIDVLGEMGTHLVIRLPQDPAQRKAILELINEHFGDEDEQRTDHGQKYELVTPD